MKRYLIPIVLCGVVVATLSTAQAQNVKIGVFDPLRVSEETAEGQRIAAKLRAFFDQKQAELAALQEQITNLQEQANTQALSLSEAKRQELGRDIQRKQLELQSAREAATRELQLEQAEAEGQFQTQILQVVDAFAKREGFTLILDRNSVVWAAQAIDVTTGIVDLFNQAAAGGDEGAAGE